MTGKTWRWCLVKANIEIIALNLSTAIAGRPLASFHSVEFSALTGASSELLAGAVRRDRRCEVALVEIGLIALRLLMERQAESMRAERELAFALGKASRM